MTAILIDGEVLWIANVGDSRAVLSKRGQAIQMSVDHEPNTERGSIENKGGFVSNMPGTLKKSLFILFLLFMLEELNNKYDYCTTLCTSFSTGHIL